MSCILWPLEKIPAETSFTKEPNRKEPVFVQFSRLFFPGPKKLVQCTKINGKIDKNNCKYCYSTLIYATLHYSTLLYATLRYSTLLYATIRYSTLLYATLRYSTLLYASPLYSTLLYQNFFLIPLGGTTRKISPL
jgi:hypothetical protein